MDVFKDVSDKSGTGLHESGLEETDGDVNVHNDQLKTLQSQNTVEK